MSINQQSIMESDIIDEIESYLSKYRCTTKILKISTEDPEKCDAPARFNKTWCTLSLSEKLNRLMHYHSKVCLKLNLNSSQSEDLHKFFYEHVNNSLASDDCVSYDSVEGEIITIMGLKYEDNRFYIYSRSEQSRPEGIRVKQRIFTSIDEFVHAQAANESGKKETSGTSAQVESEPPPALRSAFKKVTTAEVKVRSPQLKIQQAEPEPPFEPQLKPELQLQSPFELKPPSDPQPTFELKSPSDPQPPQEKAKVKLVIKKKLNPDN